MNGIIEKVIEHIEKDKLLKVGESLLLSMSAGKDSMAMLHILNFIKERYSLSMGIFHLNHMVRGEEADKDEEFIRKAAADFKLPLFVERFDFLKYPEKDISFEEQARKIRYRLLEQISGEKGYSLIATGHNRDDNAETVLMRILEGTGLQGLSGITSKRGNIIRPLLPLTAEEIYNFLETNKYTWREDESNKDSKYQRNFLRNDVIPGMTGRFPRYRESLERLGLLADEHLSLLGRLIKSQAGEVITENSGDRVLLSGKVDNDPQLLKYLVAKVLQGIPGTYAGYSRIEEILKKYYHGGSHVVLYESDPLQVKKTLKDSEQVIIFSGEKRVAECEGEWEYHEKVSLQGTSTIDIMETGLKLEVFLADYRYFEDKKASPDHIFVTIDRPDISFIIRNRRNGDRIKFGYGTKKIKKFLIEKKLDNEIKNCVPLLIIENEIAAIMSGFITDSDNCIADSCLVTEKKQYILAVRNT